MTQDNLTMPYVPTPSPSRLRYVEARIEADAEAVLREIAYVLALTQRVKHDIVNARPESATAGA